LIHIQTKPEATTSHEAHDVQLLQSNIVGLPLSLCNNNNKI